MADSWGPVTKPTVSGAKKILSSGDPVEYDEHGAKATPEHPANAPADASTHGWESVDHCSGPVADGDWSHPTAQFPDSGVWKQT
jgi:hypothetical protein